MHKLDAGTREIMCLNKLPGTKMYGGSSGCCEKRCTVSQVFAGIRNLQCHK